ncbi:LPXTG cell wall anchor domain-containing protein, partial [Streptococcus suis]|uniref:LPXTG cell wall anchor domain-containing protein n=1 Tax=Streptococcus suis TaxID=1307 RepID=UPI00128FE464
IVYLQASTSSEGFGEFKFVYTEPKVVTPDEQQSDQGNTGQDIVLESGQRITLPAVNPPAPAPQHKLASPHSQTSTKTLPATGEATSMLSLLGLTLIGFVGAWTKKKEHL